jgi:hypothetical protein
MRSFPTLAIGLSIAQLSSCRVPTTPEAIDAGNQAPNAVAQWFNKLLKRAPGDLVCVEDEYYAFISNPDSGRQICQEFVTYPDNTATVTETARR